jgi:hypothetical protein
VKEVRKLHTDTAKFAISDYELMCFELLTAAIFKIVVFWALTPCGFCGCVLIFRKNMPFPSSGSCQFGNKPDYRGYKESGYGTQGKRAKKAT